MRAADAGGFSHKSWSCSPSLSLPSSHLPSFSPLPELCRGMAPCAGQQNEFPAICFPVISGARREVGRPCLCRPIPLHGAAGSSHSCGHVHGHSVCLLPGGVQGRLLPAALGQAHRLLTSSLCVLPARGWGGERVEAAWHTQPPIRMAWKHCPWWEGGLRQPSLQPAYLWGVSGSTYWMCDAVRATSGLAVRLDTICTD